MEHKQSDKPKRPWLPWAISGLVLIIIILLDTHYTNVRYWQDPITSAQEFIKVKSAHTDLERADAHLSIAENHYHGFIALSKSSPHSVWLKKQATQMVRQDDAAMYYMDQAKKANKDIKNLVKRLCDDLDNQYALLQKANLSSAAHIADMSTYAWSLEAAYSGQLKQVQTGLEKAMSW